MLPYAQSSDINRPARRTRFDKKARLRANDRQQNFRALESRGRSWHNQCSSCPNSKSNLLFPRRPRWLRCCTCIHRSCRVFVPAMNCSLNPLVCRFRPTPLSPLATISIRSVIAAHASWRPLATLGFPARTSSTPTHFLMSYTQTRSRCPLRIFRQRCCGFSCQVDIARSTNSALLPTVSSEPPRADGKAR